MFEAVNTRFYPPNFNWSVLGMEWSPNYVADRSDSIVIVKRLIRSTNTTLLAKSEFNILFVVVFLAGFFVVMASGVVRYGPHQN